MRGMKSDDILAIVDFLCRGEANVHQENLESFLAIAQELQLKGLMGKQDKKVEDFLVHQKPTLPNRRPLFETLPEAQRTQGIDSLN